MRCGFWRRRHGRNFFNRLNAWRRRKARVKGQWGHDFANARHLPKGVVVGLWTHTFGNAQQIHKAASSVSGCAAVAQTSCRSFQLGAQVGAALQRLNDGGSGGRRAYRAVLRGGSLYGLGHAVVKPHILLRSHGQQAAVFHKEFNPRITHGAHGFTFLQGVARLEDAADALFTDSYSSAITCDSGDSCKFSHDDSR